MVNRLVAQLRNLGVDIKHHNHQMIVSGTRKVTVEQTGIVWCTSDEIGHVGSNE
jgi:hypothetical protein